MPIFTYKCEQCEYQKEVLCGNIDKSLKCKYCKEFKMKRQIGTPAFKLKGRGFYINDYPQRKS
jgi:putative FmdB family regulatory protein